MENLSGGALTKYERQLKSEERRALIWIGILSIIVAFDFWLKDHDPNATFNFACNYPCPHVTFPWFPFLDLLTYFWIGYAICMLVYFSEDIFPSSNPMFEARRYARNLGHGFLTLYPTLTGFVIIFSEIEFLIPQWVPPAIQLVYVYFEGNLLIFLLLWDLETFTGFDGQFVRKLARTEVVAGRAFFEIAYWIGEVLIWLLEKFVTIVSWGRPPRRMIILWSKGKILLDRRKRAT